MASYPTMIEAVPGMQRARRKKAINVYLLIMTTFWNNEELPVLPDQKSQLYVICKAGAYQYYTFEELQNVADIENWKLTYVGYAMPLEGKMQLYIRDESRPDKMQAYNEFVAWLEYAVQKFNAVLNPPPVPPEMYEAHSATPQQPAVIGNDLRAFLLLLAVIVLFGNIAQIVIIAMK